MIPMTREGQREERKSPERRRLDAVRRRAAAFDGARLTLVFDGDGAGLEIVRPVTAGGGRVIGRGAPELLARFAADAGTDEAEALAAMPDDLAFVLGLLDRAIAEIRRMRAAGEASTEARRTSGVQSAGQGESRSAARAEDPKDHAAEVAMKLADSAAFRRFLDVTGGLPSAIDAADAALKARLGIKSKRELNDDPQAAARWRDLRAEFELWLRAGE